MLILTSFTAPLASLTTFSALKPFARSQLAADARVHSATGNKKLYPLREVVAWHEAKAVERALGEVDTGAMDAAKLRKLEAEAELKELDLSVKRGDLVPLDEVGDLVRESLDAVDSVLRHSPSRFAPALAKEGNVPLKRARTVLREMVELVRGAIRDGAKVGPAVDSEAPDAA